MMRSRSRYALLISAVSGALLPLAFEPFGFWPIAVASLAGLFFSLIGAGPRQAFFTALVFGLLSFLLGTYWTFISVTVFYGAPAALGVAATGGLTLVLALFFAVVVALVARFVPLAGWRGMLLALPAAWLLAEWCRSWMFTGFGWLSAGYSQSDTWLIALAPILGLHGIGYAVALTAGSVLMLLLGRSRQRIAGLVCIVAVWGIAGALDGSRWTRPKPELLNIAIAQAAIPQDQKWLREQYLPTLETYRELSLQASGRDLIIWPEVAVPNLFMYAREYLEGVQREISASGSTLVTGILRNHSDGNERNAVVAMTPQPQFYLKRHLVPFGEYLPVPEFVKNALREFGIPFPDIGAGAADQPLLEAARERIAVSICYEDVFGNEQRSFFPEATLVVNVANDAWFGNSIAADQHLQIARLRAAEVGRYVLRATNTGVSAVIDPLGNVVQRGPKFEVALINATVQGFEGATPYVRWGNYPVVVVALAALVAAAIATRRRG